MFHCLIKLITLCSLRTRPVFIESEEVVEMEVQTVRLLMLFVVERIRVELYPLCK